MDKYKIKKILFIVFLLAGVGTFCFWKISSKKNCDHCNILIVDIDLLRADDLPCYGYTRNTAPNICEFAKRSVTFMDNYSTSYWTLPSIYSTITSLYPTFHGIQSSATDKLSPNIPTLAETLRKQGYKTVLANAREDTKQLLAEENGGLKGFDLITSKPLEDLITELSKEPQPWFVYYYNADLHLPYLLSENEKPMENTPKPENLPITQHEFYLVLNKYLKENYKEIFKKEAIDKYGSIILGPDKPDDTRLADFVMSVMFTDKETKYLFDAWNSVLESYINSFDKNNAQDRDYVRMIYDTKINLLDQQLAGVFKKLDLKSFSKNTITVVTSDHGEDFGEHGTFSHCGNYHSELYYTPLIIKAPQLSDKQIEKPTSNVDIFPTVMELAGLETPDNLQGISLVPYVKGKKDNSRPFIISEFVSNTILQNKEWLYFVPIEDSDFKKVELYNKINDPAEKENVASKYPELIQQLNKQADLLRSYNIYYENNRNKSALGRYQDVDPEKIERMKKEGYF